MAVSQPVLNTEGPGESLEYGNGSRAEIAVGGDQSDGEYAVVRYQVRAGDEPSTGLVIGRYPKRRPQFLSERALTAVRGGTMCNRWVRHPNLGTVEERRMVTIAHKETGETLVDVDGDSLANARLARQSLFCAALDDASIENADLRAADLCQSSMRRAKLAGARLGGADLTDSDLSEAGLQHATADRARLLGVRLQRADLRGINLERCLAEHVDLTNARLTDAMLRGAQLTRANLTGANAEGADLTEADLSFANLTGASLAHASLVGAVLRGASLNGTSLRKAELSATLFVDANLEDADVTDAILSKTVFVRCHNLHRARGLDSVVHVAPSSIDLATLAHSGARLPEAFLESMGADGEALRVAR